MPTPLGWQARWSMTGSRRWEKSWWRATPTVPWNSMKSSSPWGWIVQFVDGSEILQSPVEVGSSWHYLRGFVLTRWLGMGFLNHQQCHNPTNGRKTLVTAETCWGFVSMKLVSSIHRGKISNSSCSCCYCCCCCCCCCCLLLLFVVVVCCCCLLLLLLLLLWLWLWLLVVVVGGGCWWWWWRLEN